MNRHEIGPDYPSEVASGALPRSRAVKQSPQLRTPSPDAFVASKVTGSAGCDSLIAYGCV